MRKSVDLPAPDRPMTPMNPPRSIVNETSATAVFDPNRRVSFSMTNMTRTP